jgi:hypothetical protein
MILCYQALSRAKVSRLLGFDPLILSFKLLEPILRIFFSICILQNSFCSANKNCQF